MNIAKASLDLLRLSACERASVVSCVDAFLNEREIVRNKEAFVGGCIYAAMVKDGIPIDMKDLAKSLGIKPPQLGRYIKKAMQCLNVADDAPEYLLAVAGRRIAEACQLLGLPDDVHWRAARLAEALCPHVEKVEMKTLAAGCIHFASLELGAPVFKKNICRAADIAEPTLQAVIKKINSARASPVCAWPGLEEPPAPAPATTTALPARWSGAAGPGPRFPEVIVSCSGSGSSDFGSGASGLHCASQMAEESTVADSNIDELFDDPAMYVDIEEFLRANADDLFGCSEGLGLSTGIMPTGLSTDIMPVGLLYGEGGFMTGPLGH